MNATNLGIFPKISEKSYYLSEKRNTYVFEVPKSVNKITVKNAVQAQYNVTVTDVNIAVVKGKIKRSYRKKSQRTEQGSRPAVKKAYVVLKEGDSISVFAGQSEESKDKDTDKSKKKDKK